MESVDRGVLAARADVEAGHAAVARGDYLGARACFERAMEVLQRHLGSDHEEVLELAEDRIALEEMASVADFSESMRAMDPSWRAPGTVAGGGDPQ